jgi:hypothetical protein
MAQRLKRGLVELGRITLVPLHVMNIRRRDVHSLPQSILAPRMRRQMSRAPGSPLAIVQTVDVGITLHFGQRMLRAPA